MVASIPAAIIGFLFRDAIKQVLFNPPVVAASLIVGGIIFLIVERGPRTESVSHTLMEISLPQALLIGLAQMTALIPGVSRSGASIVGGLYVGLDRRTATQFSFYLAIPVLGGATVIEFLGALHQISNDQLFALVLGAVVSGVVAWLSIDLLLRYISNNSFVIFGYYRILAGVLILVAVAAHLI